MNGMTYDDKGLFWKTRRRYVLHILSHTCEACFPSDICIAHSFQAHNMDDPTSSTSQPPTTPTDNDAIELTLKHGSIPYTFTLPSTSTIADLSAAIESTLSIPTSNQKLIISPKPGLLKPPFPTDISVSSIATRKITLLGSTVAQLESLNSSIATAKTQSQRRTYTGPVKPATPARTRNWEAAQADVTYTFLQLRPLPYLPHPERSMQYLERLRDDPGIKATMRKHQWSVPLLTEMNPADHTTHESKTLGLNRNKGEVIELRLRTDSYDGYRDYKTIRKTLCHELAHNVWSEHDRNFWDLTGQIEKEVEKGDWSRGGHRVGEEEYAPGVRVVYGRDGDQEVHDHGSWTGGEFVLGSASSTGQSASGPALSRREIMAKAAEERMKRQNEGGKEAGPS